MNTPIPPAKGLAHALVLAKGFPPTSGGVEQYSLQVAAAYARAGYETTVITQTEGARQSELADAGNGATIRVQNVGSGGQFQVFVKMIIATIALRAHIRPTFVHAATWRVGIVALLALPRVPMVLTVHGREVLNYPNLVRPLLFAVLRHANLVLAVSHATLDLLASVVPGVHRKPNWIVAYNGLSWPALAKGTETLRESNDEIHILCLSRLTPRKNIDGAIRAVAKLIGRGFALQLRIAGTGTERARLESLAMSLGIADRVMFLGFVDNEMVPHLYRWAEIFLHPHTHVGEGRDFEGFGISIADAMSFGCAAIVGDDGGPRELIEDHITGLLVNGLDNDEVTTALQELAADHALRARIGASARTEALRRFDWDAHITTALSALSNGTSQAASARAR